MSLDSDPDPLRDQLVRLAVRRHRRRSLRRRAAAASAALVGLLGLAGLALGPLAPLGPLGPRPANAEVRVEQTDQGLVVMLVDLEHDPTAIRAALARAGVRATVTAVPVGPSLVGRFVGDTQEGRRSAALEPLDRRSDPATCSFPGFALPRGWSGELHLQVGRPAQPDEPYGAFSDAVAPGEPLAGLPVVGHPIGEVAARLATSHLDLDVVAVDRGPSAVLPLASAAQGDHAGWVVVAAEATTPDRVVLRAQRPDHPPTPARAC